jgi:hypothetical protein
MPGHTSASLIAAVSLAVALTACGSVVTPPATGPSPSVTRSAAAVPGPPAGSRAEAAVLARQLLARLRLPPGARRLPSEPLPPSLSEPAVEYAGGSASLDQHRLFALTQPMATAAASLAAQVPPGLGESGTGSGSGPDGITMQEVDYQPRSVPAGIANAQLVLTIAPASSGGSLLRADAQVIWYPPRSAAEYIDPARYHVLSLVVTIFGRHPHTVRKVVTSQAFIARLAETLDRSQAEPTATVVCPADFEDYQLSFSVSGSSHPTVTVRANETGCGGAQVAVNGQSQPSLADYGAVGALVRQVVPVTPEI